MKVEPIRERRDIATIRKLLKDEPRNLAVFNFGINTALRASDLLALRVGQVRGLKPGDFFKIREGKSESYRMVYLNQTSHRSLSDYLAGRKNIRDDEPLFPSPGNPCESLRPGTLTQLVKLWCSTINLRGNYGAHSLRKTFGFHHRVYYGRRLSLLVKAFNHRSESQTLDYLCIDESEIRDLFMAEI